MAYVNIGGELNPKTMTKKVAEAYTIYDHNLDDKRQSQINAELYQALTNFYTKAQVDEMLANIGNIFVLVDTLPAASASTTKKIYLVPSSDQKESDVKDEYITIFENNAYKWEKIGSTNGINLEDYYTKEETNAIIANSKDVLPFDSVVASELVGIFPATDQEPNEIIYSSFYKKFIAVISNGGIPPLVAYYYAWPGYEKYVDTANNNAPYGSKVYLCDGKTYVWNGIDLVAGGGEQVQADWNQEDSTQPDYIKNKPASAISGRIWINAGNSPADIINDSSIYPDYVYGTPLEIPANNNKLILVYTINVELPLKMYVGGVEVPYDKTTGAGYNVLTSKNNYNGTIVVVVKQ